MFVVNEFMRFHWNAANVINSPWLTLCSFLVASVHRILFQCFNSFYLPFRDTYFTPFRYLNYSPANILFVEHSITTLNEPEWKKRQKQNPTNEWTKWQSENKVCVITTHHNESMGNERQIRLIRLIQDIGVRPKQCIIERLVRHSWTISQSVYQRPYKWSYTLHPLKQKQGSFITETNKPYHKTCPFMDYK